MLAALHFLSHLIDELDDRWKVGRPTEPDSFDGALVSFRHTVDAIDFWVEDIAIDREAVAGAMVLGFAINFSASYISYKLVFPTAFVILILVLLIRPNGIFSSSKGRRD